MTYKLYILVRKDIKPSVGKLMVHVGHACTNIVKYYHSQNINADLQNRFDDWYGLNGEEQTKIILEARDLEELKYWYEKSSDFFKDKGIPSVMIEDAGYYEVPKGTIICCALGPITDEEAKDIGLKKLKLFK